jgi:hypothetical protein
MRLITVPFWHLPPYLRHNIAPGTSPSGPQTITVPARTMPYIHIIFKKERAEPWMTEFESVIPKTPVDWLAQRGFGGMEYFSVKVGVEQGAAE